MDEAAIIVQEWGLDAGLHSKEEIIAALTRRINDMLMHDPMGFIQLMYRLDISESRLDQALDSENSAGIVAHLIWDRQVQKSLLRKMTPPRDKNDDELGW